MAFDAGSIDARLTVDLRQFDRDMDRAEARAKRFEDAPHRVKITAVFDASSATRARKMFGDLDNAISKDAMNRLRSSPQGSVLGALNALFSPHPVSGAPSPAQAASQGLLGRMVGAPGGGGAPDSALDPRRGGVLNQILRQQVQTTQQIRRQVTGAQPGDVVTTDTIRRRVTGAAPGNITTTDTIKEKLDPSAAEKLAQDSASSGDESGRRFTLKFSARFMKWAGGGGGGGAGGLGSGILGGIGPGILGLSAKTAGIVGGGGALLGALPALIGGLSPLLAAAPGLAGLGLLAKGSLSTVSPLTQLNTQIQTEQTAGLGATAAGAKQIQQQQAQLAAGFAALPAAQKQMYTAITNIQNAWQNLTASFAPVMAKALTAVSNLFTQLLPQLNKFFQASAQLMGPLIGGLGDIAKQLLPLFTAGIKAAVPVLRPLLDGLGSLVAGILPGLITLVKASAPAVRVLAQIFGTLGKDLGAFFAAFAPVLGPSGVLLKAFLDLIGALLPIVAKLAGVFATALAPVFVQFAGVIRSLLPFLTIIGKVLAALASAVLGDLVAAFSALAGLLIAIGPSLKIFADALSQSFAVLENSGVFAVLGNTLEAIIPPLAKLINLVIAQLAPELPIIITLVSQFATILVDLLAAGLTAVLSGITFLLTKMPFLVPLIGAITAVWVAWNLVMAANPIGLIIIAVGALIGAIVLLATHWGRVWGDIKNWAMDAWNFLTHGWGQFLFPGLTLIVKTVEFVRDHWRQAWTDMKNWAADTWHAIYNTVLAPLINWFTASLPHAFNTAWAHVQGWWADVKNAFVAGWQWVYRNVLAPIGTFFTQTLPGWFTTAVNKIGQFWDNLQGAVEAPVKWIFQHVFDPLGSGFDFITNALGFGKPIKVPIIAGWAGGGKIPYGTTETADDVLIRVSKGETILSGMQSRLLAPLLGAIGVPGYAQGGRVGQNAPSGSSSNPPPKGRHGRPGNVNDGTGNPFGFLAHLLGKAVDIGKLALALATGNSAAFANAFDGLLGLSQHSGAGGLLSEILVGMPKTIVKDLVSWIMGKGSSLGNGGDIVKYAMSWLGKVPYVWGGVSIPGGADCSGFVQAVYRHFGIDAPRTSEAQGAWVKRSGPTPGGLAFYHSPPGGPDPGHVAIVRDLVSVISQGGGMGPQLMNLHAMPLLWTGVPPGGLGPAGGGVPGIGGSVVNWIIAALNDTGGPMSWLKPLETLVSKESGGNPRAYNPIPVFGEHAEGLFQTLPSTFAQFATVAGGIWNPIADAVAGIRYIMATYGSPFNIPGLLSGTYKGYAGGGPITEPVIGWGVNSGATYSFAERGPEWVSPMSPMGGMGGHGAAQLADTINLMMPEGSTLAQAFSELTWQLQAARMRQVLPGG